MPVLLLLLGPFISVPGIIIAFTTHEYIKAAASSALGDAAVKGQGRLTLNPLKHFEPIGFICLFFFGLGWGKPVETRPFAYRDRKKGVILVYTLPSAVNLLLGVLFGICAAMWASGWAYDILQAAAYVNVSYAVFNLIPVYPLDCARVVSALNPEWGMKLKQYERIIQVVVMLLLFFGILNTFIRSIASIILGFM